MEAKRSNHLPDHTASQRGKSSRTNLLFIVNLYGNYIFVYFIMLVEKTCSVVKDLILRLVREALVILLFDFNVNASVFGFGILEMRRRNVSPWAFVYSIT